MAKNKSAEKARRSSCGAPIPSFKTELDQLERDLQDDDDDHQQWRKRKECRKQNKDLKREQQRTVATTSTKQVVDAASLVLGSDGGASDDKDDDDDDDRLLSFDFLRKNPLGTAKESVTSDGPLVPMKNGKENNDDETNHSHGVPLDDDCLASEPLADSTNSQDTDDVPSVRVVAGTLAEPVSNPELRAVHGQSVTTPVVPAVEASGEATCTLSQAVVEIFERSDVRTCTCKQVWKQLEERHGFQLDNAAKKLVRSQLTVLTQQYLVTMSHYTTIAPLDVKEPSESANAEKSDAGTTEPSAGERKSKDAARAAAPGKGERAVGLGTLPMPDDSGAHKDAPTQPQASKSNACPSRRKRREAPEAQAEPIAGGQSETAPDGTLPAPPPQTKRRGRPPKAPRTSRNMNAVPEGQSRGTKRVFPDVGRSAPAAAAPSLPTKAKRNQPQCALCKACPCRHPPASTTGSVLNLAQSDSAVEKALMRRLLKLEETADRYDEQTEVVRRKLKKHRREMWRKLDPSKEESQKGAEYRFLPDAEDMDRESAALTGSKPLGESSIQNAKCSLFSFASTYQPTLTQMFGGHPKKDEDGCDGIDVDESHPGFEERDSQMEVDVETEETAAVEEADALLYTGGSDAVLDFERVETRNGVGMTEEASRIWGAHSTAGGYKALWDRIFDDPKEAEGLTLEELETMFDDVPPPDAEVTDNSQIRLSMLTQRGQLLAEEIGMRVNVSPGRASRLTFACPKWQENVLFALHQDRAVDVRSALAGVSETQSRLRRSKEAVLKAIEAQEELMSVFAEALTASLTRLDDVERPNLCHASTSSQPKQMISSSIDGDDGDAPCETKTLSVSSSSPLSSQEDS